MNLKKKKKVFFFLGFQFPEEIFFDNFFFAIFLQFGFQCGS
jgi:hypothetical protein